MNASDRFRALLRTGYPSENIPGTDIPVFAPRPLDEREADRYDKDFTAVDRYAGLFAFGHILLGRGEAEGLYRTIDAAVLAYLPRDSEQTVLDLGCGVGRTIYDCAGLFPHTLFVGMDYAYNMCQRAHELLIDMTRLDLSRVLAPSGFVASSLSLPTANQARNVFIAQGDATDLPFLDASFDCVTNTYLVDRINKNDGPRQAIVEMGRVLKPGGLFVLSDPLGFDHEAARRSIPDARTLQRVVIDAGIDLLECFDGLLYREVKDTRGNHSDYLTLVCIGRKRT